MWFVAMADENPQPARRKRKSVFEATEREKEGEKERNQTEVFLGDSFQRWRDLKEAKRLKTDALVAKFLLDSYDNVTSAPRPQTQWVEPPQPPGSTTVEDSLSERDEPTEDMDEEEFNSLQNTTIDWDDETWSPEMETETQSSSEEDETEEFDSDDSRDLDYTPPIRLRAGGALEQPFCVDSLPQIHVDETVHDEPDGCGTVEETVPPHTAMALTEEDVLGQQASIVYHDVLKQLLDALILPVGKCTAQDPVTKMPCDAAGAFKVSLRRRDTAVIAEWTCPNGHSVWTWSSQRHFKCGLPAGDFMLGVNVLLSGNDFRKVALLFKFMNLGMIDPTTFHKIQDGFCVDNIADFWRKDTEGIIDGLKDKEPVVLLGDSRSESPGFCTYSMMDNETKKIVSVHSSDRPERQTPSVTVEKHCFLKCMDEIMKDLTVTEVCTDAHAQISSLFKSGEYKDKGIKHSLDVWRGAKDLNRKILAAGRQEECRLLLTWNREITNHFWYCCKTAETYEHFMDLWTGLLHHVTGVHQWCFGSCHRERERNKPLIPKGSVAHQRLRDLMMDSRWLKTVTKFLSFRSTVALESFHNHILMYAGKHSAFSKRVYEARVYLASLDYNNHLNRGPRRKQDGSTQKGKLYSQRTKMWRLYRHRATKEYRYIPDLQALILRAGLLSPGGTAESATTRPDDPGPRPGFVAGNIAPTTPELQPVSIGLSVQLPSPALTPHIKEEHDIKQEEDELQVSVPEFSGVSVKTEESLLQQTEQSENTQEEDVKPEIQLHFEDVKPEIQLHFEDVKPEIQLHFEDVKLETYAHFEDVKLETYAHFEDVKPETYAHFEDVKPEIRVSFEDTQEDVRAETDSETEGDTDHSSDSDKDGDEFAPEARAAAVVKGTVPGSRDREYKCSFCNEKFGSRYKLRVHKRVHTGGKAFKCTICKKVFPERSKLKRHTMTHTGERPFSCSVCKKMFAENSKLKTHMRRHTGEKPFSCSVCVKLFADTSQLRTHLRTHTGEKPYICSVCTKPFGRKAHLDIHMMTHTGEKPFSCSVCTKMFSVSAKLKVHMKTHTATVEKEKPFSCSVCQKTFTRKSDKEKHMRTHTGEKPYSCSICQKEFADSSSLTPHMRTHTGEKPFRCSVCKKVFTVSSDLKKHMRTHTGEKPFSCSVCQKEFADSSSLKPHMRTHTEEEPFRCSVCKKTFGGQSNLDKHMARHSETPLSCSVCQKEFYVSSKLKRHMRTHTGEKPFGCSFCKKRFAESSKLKAHMGTQHRTE